MAERATINQTVQIGVETTPGTPVAATKSLGSIGFGFGIKIDSNASRPTGQKYASQQIVGKEWAEAEIEGNPGYEELQYVLSSVLSTPTTTPIANGGNANAATLWKFDSNSRGDDTPKTFTIEQGSSTRAHRVSNAIVSELTMEFSRDEISLGGSVLAKAIEDGIVMTSTGVSGLKQVPILPAQLSLYLDDTSAALGTTKLTRALSGEISISDRYGPLWVIDRAQNSFVNTIETEPDVSFKIKQMADAQAMANLTAMRGGATKFLRLEAVGPLLFGTTNYKFTMDLAGQVSDVDDFDDEDGVFAVEWTFGAVHDPTWGKAIHAELTNTTQAL